MKKIEKKNGFTCIIYQNQYVYIGVYITNTDWRTQSFFAMKSLLFEWRKAGVYPTHNNQKWEDKQVYVPQSISFFMSLIVKIMDVFPLGTSGSNEDT